MEVKYSQWIGKKVSKTNLRRDKNPKPFKSGLISNTVKNVTVNPNTGKIAFSFEEDDSIVDCHICELSIK
jgi:hypothetical protein